MNFPVYAMVGLRYEEFDTTSKDRQGTTVIGRSTATETLIMHGFTYLTEKDTRGYAYLFASLEIVSEYFQKPLRDRGEGAVTGGCIFTSSHDSADVWTKEQSWGKVGAGREHEIGFFYSSCNKLSYRPYVYFSTERDEAPIVAFWRNGKPTFGPNRQMEQLGWGLNICSSPDTGHYGLSLAAVDTIVVVDLIFPKIDSDMCNIVPEAVVTKTFTNDRDIEAKKTFKYSVTSTQQATFVHKFGAVAGVSGTYTVKVPYLVEAGGTIEVKLSYDYNSSTLAGESTLFEDTIEIPMAPRSAMRAEMAWKRGTLTLDAKLKLLVTYKGGFQQVIEQTVKYESVNCHSETVVLRDLPYTPNVSGLIGDMTIEKHMAEMSI